MTRWWIFFRERLPLPVLALMSIGAGLSQGLYVVPALMPALFLVTLRIMDEVKDYDKDVTLHPDRPLPRGVITLAEATRAIQVGLAAMVLFGCGLLLFGKMIAGFLYLFCTGYLWLMFKEFYYGQALNKSPFFYAVTHQIVMLPLAGAIHAYSDINGNLIALCLTPGLLYLGAFFTFEICRKLDPSASPLLGTYRVHYGIFLTFLMVLLTSFVTAFGAAFLGSRSLPFMVMAMLPPCAYALFIRKNHKTVEAVSALILLIMIWAPFVLRVLP